MKAEIKCMGCVVTVESEPGDIKGLLRQISGVQEIMGARSCGLCGESDNLSFKVRKHDAYEFFEVKCGNKDCGATFSFGQRKDGSGLFPKEWARYGQASADDSPF